MPDLAPKVECDGKPHPALAQPEGHAAPGSLAAPGDLEPGLGHAHHLDVAPELVGPEPRNLGIGPGVAAHVVCGRDRLILRVLPRLEPDPATQKRVVVAGRIA